MPTFDLVKEFMNVINAEYFLKDKESFAESVEAPIESMKKNKKGKSRIFDLAAYQIKPPESFFQRYEQLVLTYGTEYALAELINPLIEAVVDVQNHKLTEAFIAKIGQENYDTLKSAYPDQAEAEVAKQLLSACSVFFTQLTPKENHLPLTNFITGVSGAEINRLQQKGTLYNCANKYLLCPEMEKDIDAIGIKFSIKDELNTHIDRIDDSFNSSTKDRAALYSKFVMLLREKYNTNDNAFKTECDSLLLKYRYPDIMSLLTPETYFNLELSPNEGHWMTTALTEHGDNPKQYVSEGGNSRIFDFLAYCPDAKIPDIIQEAFLKDVYNHGYGYALSKHVNHYVDAIVDRENKKLKVSFIENNLGRANYEICLKTSIEQIEQMELSGRSTDSKEDITKKAEFELANRFIHACSLYFTQSLTTSKQNHLPFTSYNEYCTLVSSSTNQLKLHNKDEKFFICRSMVKDIFDFFSELDEHDLLSDIQQKINTIEEQDVDKTVPLIYLYALLKFKCEKVQSQEITQRADLLLSKYKFDDKQIYKILALGALTLLTLAASVAVLFLTHGLTAPVIVPLIGKQISAIVAICATAGATLASLASTISTYCSYKQKYHQHEHVKDVAVITDKTDLRTDIAHSNDEEHPNKP